MAAPSAGALQPQLQQPVIRDPQTGLALLLEPPIASLKDKFRTLFVQHGGHAIIHYMQIVNKISSKGKRQPRVLFISRKVLYLTELNTAAKRCIPVADIQQVIVARNTIAFRVPRQYDVFLEISTGSQESDAAEMEYLINILKVIFQHVTGMRGSHVDQWVTRIPAPAHIRKARDLGPDIQLRMDKPKDFKFTFVLLPVLPLAQVSRLLQQAQEPPNLPLPETSPRRPPFQCSPPRTRIEEATKRPASPSPSHAPSEVERAHPILRRSTIELPKRLPSPSPTSNVSISTATEPLRRPPLVESAVQAGDDEPQGAPRRVSTVGVGTGSPSPTSSPESNSFPDHHHQHHPPHHHSHHTRVPPPPPPPPLPPQLPPQHQSPQQRPAPRNLLPSDLALLTPSDEFYRRQLKDLRGQQRDLAAANRQHLQMLHSQTQAHHAVDPIPDLPLPPPAPTDTSFLPPSRHGHPPPPHSPPPSAPQDGRSIKMIEQLEEDVKNLQAEMLKMAEEKEREIRHLRQSLAERSRADISEHRTPRQYRGALDMSEDDTLLELKPLLSKVPGSSLIAPSPGVRLRNTERATGADPAPAPEAPPSSAPQPPPVAQPPPDKPSGDSVGDIMEKPVASASEPDALVRHLTEEQCKSVEKRRKQIEEVQRQVDAMVASGRYTAHSTEIIELQRQLEAVTKDLEYEARSYELGLLVGPPSNDDESGSDSEASGDDKLDHFVATSSPIARYADPPGVSPYHHEIPRVYGEPQHVTHSDRHPSPKRPWVPPPGRTSPHRERETPSARSSPARRQPSGAGSRTTSPHYVPPGPAPTDIYSPYYYYYYYYNPYYAQYLRHLPRRHSGYQEEGYPPPPDHPYPTGWAPPSPGPSPRPAYRHSPTPSPRSGRRGSMGAAHYGGGPQGQGVMPDDIHRWINGTVQPRGRTPVKSPREATSRSNSRRRRHTPSRRTTSPHHSRHW